MLLPNVADAMQNERVFISTTQVDVAECWKFCSYHHANSFFVFFGLGGFASFAKCWLRVSWLHGFVGVHRNQNHKHKETTNTAYTQTKTMPSAVVGVFLQVHQPTTKRQQPTTNNGLQIACQMQDSSSKMLQRASKLEGSSSKMLQIASKMEGSSSKLLLIASKMEDSSSANRTENRHTRNIE